MKSAIIATICLSLACSAIAAKGGFETGEKAPPAHSQDSGYKGTEDTHENRVGNLHDYDAGRWVTLEGYLTDKKAQDSYTFRDDSGTMTVNIAQAVWKERTFDASDKVRISGKVQKKGQETQLNVERLDKP